MKLKNIIKYESSYKSIKKTSMIKVIIKFENVCKANAKEAEEILFLRWMLNGAFARLLCCHLLVSELSREDRLLQIVFNNRWKLSTISENLVNQWTDNRKKICLGNHLDVKTNIDMLKNEKKKQVSTNYYQGVLQMGTWWGKVV